MMQALTNRTRNHNTDIATEVMKGSREYVSVSQAGVRICSSLVVFLMSHLDFARKRLANSLAVLRYIDQTVLLIEYTVYAKFVYGEWMYF